MTPWETPLAICAGFFWLGSDVAFQSVEATGLRNTSEKTHDGSGDLGETRQ